MKCTISIIVALAALAGAASARGALIAYDDFAYSAGTYLAGQNGGQGFSGAWYQGGFNVSQALTTVMGSPLTYPPLTVSGAGITTPASANLNGVQRNLASSISSGTIYLSCLLNPQGTLGQGNGSGFFGLYLHGSGNDIFFGGGASRPYFVELRGGYDTHVSNTPEAVGQPAFLVLKTQLQSTGNDVFTLYGDPTPGAPEPSTGTVLNDADLGTLSSLVIYSGGAFQMGQLRIGTTYADVTPSLSPSAFAWSNSGTTWNVPTNWGGTVPSGTDTGFFTLGWYAYQPNLTAPASVGGLWATGSGSVAITGSTLTINSVAGSGVEMDSGAGGMTIGCPLSLGGSQTWLNNSASALNVAGNVANGGNTLTVAGNGNTTISGGLSGAGGLTMAGAGVFTMAGSGTFSGATRISSGTLNLAHPLSVQNSTASLTGGVLSFAAANITPALGGLAGSGNLALATAAAEPVILNVGSNGQSTTYSGVLSGAGGLVKQGSGTLVLTASSNYQGATAINSGVLKLQPVGIGGSIGIHFIGTSGNGTFTGIGGVVPMSNWNNASGYIFTGTTLANNSGVNSGATFSLNGATGIWATGSSNELLNGYVFSRSNAMTLTLGGIPYPRYSIYVYVGDSTTGYQEQATINGSTYYYTPESTSASTYDSITNTSSANYQLGNYIEADGLTGATQAVTTLGTSPGVSSICDVQIVNTAPAGGGVNLLPTTTPLSIASGGTLDLSGGSQQVGSLSDYPAGSGGSIINSSSAASVLTIGSTGGSTTFSGSIQGGGTLGAISLVINGSGTQVLAGSHTYTGGTAITAGTLQLGDGIANNGVVPGNIANNAALAFANPAAQTFSGVISGSGQLAVLGPGRLTLPGTNTFAGGTTISGGTLQLGDGVANNGVVPGNIVDNATLAFANPAAQTFSGVISGSGRLAKTGSGQFTLSGADTFSASGGIAVSQGTFAAPLGISHAGAAINIAGGASLAVGGQLKRAVSGAGTVTATNDLFIGSSAQPGQFNQGGAPGVGGTLNAGGNAVVILSADAAVLGSQTNIGAGGSLTAINGIQLGNPASLDATKVLTATDSATVNGSFVNNGVVHGPTGGGQELVFTQFVKGAGSTTGNIEYQGSYSPGNSPAAVSVENLRLDSTSRLIMEIDGLLPGSGYDQLDITGLATLDGALDVNLLNGFTPSAGESFDLFNGPTSGSFAQISLPALGSGLRWDTSNLYSTGTINVVPEPGTLALLAVGVLVLLSRVRRRR